MDMMIDIETMGTRPDAQITQIGAVLFEPRSGGKLLNASGFKEYVLIQDGAGSIDHATVCFWLQEKSAAALGRGMEEHALPLAEVLNKLTDFPDSCNVGWHNVERVWAKPPNFDLSIIASAYAKYGMNPPWDHRSTRCARTLFDITGGAPEIDWTGFVAHDALDDAIGQAMQVQKAFASIERIAI